MSDKFGIAVKCLIVNNKSEYLILEKTLREAKNDKEKNLLDLPGGRVEYTEDIRNALFREVAEETGIILPENQKFNFINAATVIKEDGLHLLILTFEVKHTWDNIKLSEEHTTYHIIRNEYSILPKWIKDIIILSKNGDGNLG